MKYKEVVLTQEQMTAIREFVEYNQPTTSKSVIAMLFERFGIVITEAKSFSDWLRHRKIYLSGDVGVINPLNRDPDIITAIKEMVVEDIRFAGNKHIALMVRERFGIVVTINQVANFIRTNNIDRFGMDEHSVLICALPRGSPVPADLLRLVGKSRKKYNYYKKKGGSSERRQRGMKNAPFGRLSMLSKPKLPDPALLATFTPRKIGYVPIGDLPPEDQCSWEGCMGSRVRRRLYCEEHCKLVYSSD